MPDTFNQVDFIASRFGGRPQLAAALEVGEHRVRDWARRKRVIPEEFRLKTLRQAEMLGIDVTPFDFIRHLVRNR